MHSIRALSAMAIIALSTAALAACTAKIPEPGPSAKPLPLTVNPACPADSTPVGPSASELSDALTNARAGDTLALAEATYVGNFEITTSGTAEEPITLCGSAASVINGGTLDSGYALHLQSADYWRLQGFSVTNASKGIMLDDSSHNVLASLDISRIGEEGVHFRTGSSANELENSRISDTGLVTAEFGEGVYIGSAESNWCRYTACEPDTSDRNIIRETTIFNTTAEAIDVKEGTTAGEIRGNSLSFPASADVESAVNLKGNAWIVDANTIEAESGDGIRIHSILKGWGASNVITANTIGTPTGRLGIEVVGNARELGNIIGCDNLTPSGVAVSTNVACR